MSGDAAPLASAALIAVGDELLLGRTVDTNSRITPVRTPQVWTSLHIVSQRRHMMHLSMSRMMEGEMSFR